MNLSWGSYGQAVRDLQQAMNKLPPTLLALLTVDGRFGPKTRARVLEFQGNNRLAADGIVGPKTMGVIEQLLELLSVAPPPSPASQASDAKVRPITKQILGMEPTDGLIEQIIPPVTVISVPTFKPGVIRNAPQFTGTPMRTARLGIFAAGKASSSERAVILVLPGSAVPDRVVIGISHGFGQNADYYGNLGWSDPLSPPLILDVLLRHVVKRWAPQVLAATPARAYLHIVRAAGRELGPFANDGAFVRNVLSALVGLTNNGFLFQHVETFTYSSGIDDLNVFIGAASGHFNIEAVYSQDPAKATPARRPPNAKLRQFLSGMTGPPRPGFEFMPLHRWKHELFYYQYKAVGEFEYLHNFVMPQYTLHLGMQMP